MKKYVFLFIASLIAVLTIGYFPIGEEKTIEVKKEIDNSKEVDSAYLATINMDVLTERVKNNTYFKQGKFKNKDVSNFRIDSVFSDWEILMVLKRIEGYYDSSSKVAVSHNNPCNLKYGALPRKHGATKGQLEVAYGEGDNFAYFKTIESGNNACIELIDRMKKKYPTTRQFFTKWSSESGGNIYMKFVNNLVNKNDYPLDFNGTDF